MTYAMISGGCNLAVCDEQKRARICGADATTTRVIDDVTFSACASCAAALDARNVTPPLAIPRALAILVRDARGHAQAPGSRPPKRRVVVRIDAPDIIRLDALRKFMGVSRATVVRAFVVFGLDTADGPVKPPAPEPTTPAPEPTEGGAP